MPASNVVYSDPAGNSITTGASAAGAVTVLSPLPVITSAASADGTTGATFSYQIAATNGPTGFSAAGLPAGLSVNADTGLISGTPTAAGTSNVTVSAFNAGGTGAQTLSLTVYSACDLNRGPTNSTSSAVRQHGA